MVIHSLTRSRVSVSVTRVRTFAHRLFLCVVLSFAVSPEKVGAITVLLVTGCVVELHVGACVASPPQWKRVVVVV